MNVARVEIDRVETKVARCGDMEVFVFPTYADGHVLQFKSKPDIPWSSGQIDKSLARDLALALLAFIEDPP